MRFLLLGAVIVAVGALLFNHGRRQALDPNYSRAGLVLRYGIGTFCGVLLGLVLPRWVPDTPGSPATLVILLVLWLTGGGLGFLSLAALVGVVSAPRADQ